MSDLRLGSLFDGSGGFPLAGMRHGIVPVWASEIDPFAIRVTTKRIPQMKHYGDITTLNGADLPPVDMVTFGSPCTDVSVAGRREGLDGKQSSLFYEAIRIIKEMRGATNGRYPRYAIYENVPGVFSSKQGDDFRQILEQIVQIKDERLYVPLPAKRKWLYAGTIVGDSFSIAWRVLDAQFFGVPQRRRRVFIVCDFGGNRASEILFESDSVCGNTTQSVGERQATTADSKRGSAPTISLEPGAMSRLGGHVDTDITCTIRAHMGDNQVCVLEKRLVPLTMKIRSGKLGGGKGALLQPDKSATLSCNNEQTLFVPLCIQGNIIGRADHNGANGIGVSEDISYALTCTDRHSVFYQSGFGGFVEGNCGTLCHSGGALGGGSETLVSQSDYAIRKLTPLECCRLQGFPDDWCKDLHTDDPTDDDIAFWSDVFETYRKALGKSSKPKSRNQIVSWLRNPYSDSAEYRLWGNGICLPVVSMIMQRIIYSERQ